MRPILLAVLCLAMLAPPAAALPPVHTPLNPFTVSATTGEKPQSKVWSHAGTWWCVMPNGSGTWVWRLDGTSWTNVLKLSNATGVHADVKASGAVSQVLLFNAGSSELASIEYVSASHSYQAWSARPANVALPLDGSTETATLEQDTQGRLWVVSDHAAGADQIVVYYSDAPYSSWSGPVTLASGIHADDIAVVTALAGGRIGVLWSNQNTQRFGFRTHLDGTDPASWTADEVPASQSALNVGAGMADDHLHVAVGSDGTLYAAVKTSYDTAGYPRIALLVRRPGGSWDNLYPVDEAGTRGLVLLDEGAATVTVVYTSVESSGNILYKETPTAAIALSGPSTVLMPGGLNDPSSQKQNLAGAVVILAGNGSSVSSVLRSSGAYTITASAGSGGTITPSGAVSVSPGSNQPFTISANSGSTILDVQVDGVSAGAVGSYTFVNVTANHTITASFTADGGPAGLIGWWKLDGDVTDASGNGYDATVVGSPGYVTGQDGQALSLNGSSQYAAVPHDAALGMSNALTLATWVNPAREATQNLISKSTNGGLGGYELCLAATSSTWPHKAFFRLNQVPSGDTYRINSTTLYSDHLNSWIHLAATYDGATMKLYVNGVLESSLPAAIAIAGNTLPVGIGAQVDGSGSASRWLQGGLDDVRIYNRALSAGEIAALASLTTYTIAASAGAGGAISPSGAVMVSQGATRPSAITADSGYHVSDVVVDGGSVGAVTGYTFTNVQSPHSIVANFALDVPAGDLAGHWRMDEGSGSVVSDASSNGLHGTAVGSPAWVPGISGPYALSFVNNTSQYVTIANATPLNFTSAITVSAWIRPTKVATASILNKATFATSPAVFGFELNLSSLGVPFCRLFDDNLAAGGGRLNATATYPTDGTTWMHVAATYDRSTIKLYVNGVLNASKATTAPITTNSLPFVIGAPSDGNVARVFPGAIDDARVYSRALGAGEIAALAGAGVTHTITAAAGAGGSINPGGTVSVVDHGSQAFTIAPGACYTIADVQVDGGSVGPVTTYTFTDVTADHTIAASFALRTYTITASAGAGGAIDPSGALTVDCGTNRTFTITAGPGHHVGDVLVDGGSVGAVTSYTFTDVQAAHTIAASFAPDVVPGDLVAWWPFEEGTGTAIQDASGHGNDGTLPNGATWVTGVGNLALHLDGSSQRGTVPDSPSLDITNQITLATWVRPERVATQHLIHKGNNGGADGYEISLAMAPPSSNGKPFVRFNQLTNGNTFRLNATQPYVADGNTWTHVAATYDGTTIKLYVNGVLDTARAESFAIAANDLPVGIGSQSDGQYMLQGAIDDARVYSRALSAGEIAALAGAGVTHTITAAAGAGGSINPGGAVSVVDHGSQAFTIAPGACYTIADVQVDGGSVGPVTTYTFTDVTADHTIAASFALRTYTITASAGAGGAIDPSGAQTVDCGTNRTFTITAGPGYHVGDVLVDGSSVGAVTSYTFTDVQAAHTIAASFAPVSADVVSAQPASGTMITKDHPCVTVPVVITRTNPTPLMGFSVTVQLSSNLALCGAEFVSGGYPLAPRSFHVTPASGNRWIIDDVTLGSPCGVTGDGTLFTVDVTSPESDGSGTITIESAVARDCSNQPIEVVPGPPASIPIHRTGPARTADLVAVQVTTGNHVPPPPARATTPIQLEFSLPADAVSVEVYRAKFGAYPQYDESAGAAPGLPTYPPSANWALTGVTASGQTDEPPTRDFWYYVLVSKDAYGNTSPVSNMTLGTLDYYLGDVSDGTVACAGDNLVATSDVSLLGGHYGATLPVDDGLECLDVGPTMDYSVSARPMTDNRIDFEDLMMFSLNYGMVSAPQSAARPADAAATSSDAEQLGVWAPTTVTAGETFRVVLGLQGTGFLQGISVKLGWNPAVALPISIVSEGLFEGEGGVLFHVGLTTVDGALLGIHETGLSRAGAFATVTYRALATGNPAIEVVEIKGRDHQNHPMEVRLVNAVGVGDSPARTQFAPARPTPFTSSTTLEFGVASRGEVELAVFGIDGRRVRTLVRGIQEPGIHPITWDGRDDSGRQVVAGMYYARLTAGRERFTRTLIRLAH